MMRFRPARRRLARRDQTHAVPIAAVVTALLSGTLVAVASAAQDTRLVALLEARREQVELEAARAEHARSEQLASHGLVSDAEVERRRADMETARLELQRSLLDLVDREPYLTAERALKTRTEDGRQLLHLTLRNRTPDLTEDQRRLLREVGGEELERALASSRADAVFVAIQSNGQRPLGGAVMPEMGLGGQKTTIALPYEAQLPPLERGQAAELRFQLLRDVTSVVVAIRHPRGEREVAIELEQADTEDVADLSSTQLSLEADLATSAVFALNIERATVEPRTFRLLALGLPAAFDARFVESGGGRISRIHFPAGVKRQSVGLEILLPERPGDGFPLDRPLAFWAVAADERDAAFDAPEGLAPADIEQSSAAHLGLAIVPRGVPELEVRAGSLFEQIEVGAAAETEIRLRNTGSRRLDQIALRADAPPGWRVVVEPAAIEALAIGAEATVALSALPPASVESGEFELRLTTATLASNRPVPVADKIFRIRVEPRASVLGGLIASALLLSLIAGVVVFGMRLTRR